MSDYNNKSAIEKVEQLELFPQNEECVEYEILKEIKLKYAKRGKFAPAGAKDVRLLCDSINNLMYFINTYACKSSDWHIAKIITNNARDTMRILENEFLANK
ncbi:MAG: hypothetical protein [Podoviridae sp. cty5g4]|nr:MAG: hypothetical protein [Podoviridae sp. cty5g4]